MTYFDAYIDEWHSLVKDLRLYIAQEFPHVLQPQKTERVASKPQPAALKPVAKAATTLAARAKPKEEKHIDPPKKVLEPIIQAMPRPFIKQGAPVLHDCIEKFEKLHIKVLDAPEAKAATKPQKIVFVSFFPPGSEEEMFIQKVASSVSERLMAHELYIQPDLEACAMVCTLCASFEAKAVVLACPKDAASKLSAWLSYFGDELTACDDKKDALIGKRMLFSTPFYELSLASLDKRALWNDLKSFV